MLRGSATNPWRRYTRARQVKWPGWKIHRPGSSPGSALPSPAFCFASVIVWTENKNVTISDRSICFILTVKRRQLFLRKKVHPGNLAEGVSEITWLLLLRWCRHCSKLKTELFARAYCGASMAPAVLRDGLTAGRSEHKWLLSKTLLPSVCTCHCNSLCVNLPVCPLKKYWNRQVLSRVLYEVYYGSSAYLKVNRVSSAFFYAVIVSIWFDLDRLLLSAMFSWWINILKTKKNLLTRN